MYHSNNNATLTTEWHCCFLQLSVVSWNQLSIIHRLLTTDNYYALPPRRCAAGREEGVSHYLARLSPCSIVVRSEVWQVIGWYTRLASPTTRIPAHHAP